MERRFVSSGFFSFYAIQHSGKQKFSAGSSYDNDVNNFYLYNIVVSQTTIEKKIIDGVQRISPGIVYQTLLRISDLWGIFISRYKKAGIQENDISFTRSIFFIYEHYAGFYLLWL